MQNETQEAPPPLSVWREWVEVCVLWSSQSQHPHRRHAGATPVPAPRPSTPAVDWRPVGGFGTTAVSETWPPVQRETRALAWCSHHAACLPETWLVGAVATRRQVQRNPEIHAPWSTHTCEPHSAVSRPQNPATQQGQCTEQNRAERVDMQQQQHQTRRQKASTRKAQQRCCCWFSSNIPNPLHQRPTSIERQHPALTSDEGVSSEPVFVRVHWWRLEKQHHQSHPGLHTHES